MANASRTIRVRFDGSVAGLVAASRVAKRELSDLEKRSQVFNKTFGKGIDKAFSGLGKASAGLLALGSAANTAGALAAVGKAAVTASGSLLLLPGAALAGATALTALKLGASGFGSAIANMNDPDKFAKEIAKLSPVAREAAVALKDVVKPLRDGLQDRLFAGIAPLIRELGTNLVPAVAVGFGQINDSANRAAKSVFQMLTTSERLTDLKAIGRDSVTVFDNLAVTLRPLTAAFLDVATVGVSMLADMTKGAGSAAERFAAWVKQMREAGKIQETIRAGVDTLKDFGSVLKNLGQITGLVFKGLGTGQQSFLDGMIKTTQAVEDFLRSADGQSTLKALGDTMRVVGDVTRTVLLEALRQLGPIIRDIAPAAQEFARGLGDFLVSALQTVGPLLDGLAKFLSANKEQIRSLVPLIALAIVGLKGFKVATEVAGWVKGATTALGLFGTKAEVAGTKAATAGTKVGGLAGKFGLIKGALAVGAVAAFAVELDKVNVAAAGGADKLGLMEGNLHNLVGAGSQLASGDFSGIFADITEDLDTMVMRFKTAQSPIGEFFHWLTGQKPDPIPVGVDTAPGQAGVTEFVGGVSRNRGVVTIDGDIDPVTGKVTQSVRLADGSTGTITLDGDRIPVDGKTNGAVRFADGSKGTITIDGNQQPANGKINATVTYGNGRRAIIQVDASTAAANSNIAGLVRNWNGRHINLIVTSTGSGGIASAGRLATGGPIRGKGTGTSDTAGLFALSNGEHVFTAAEVRAMGGQSAVMAFRRGLVGGTPRRFASTSGAATGGAVRGGGGAPVVNVHVQLDSQELRPMVRTEISEASRQTRRLVGAGTYRGV